VHQPAWNTKQNGRPTVENLARYVLAYATSLELGGVNDHISRSLGYIPYPDHTVIRLNNQTREVVVERRAQALTSQQFLNSPYNAGGQ
jgi:hypothetical protein